MSGFKSDLRLALLGQLSLEAAEVPVDPSVLTVDDVQEVREERAELEESVQEVKNATLGKEMEASVAVVTAVGNAAKAAETMPKAAASAYVATANMNIQTAEHVLNAEIPKLVVNSDGSVDTVSLESLSEWFGSAFKAFGVAASKAGGRIALGFVRLNDSARGLDKRAKRVKDKVRSRKGHGGVAIKLPKDVARLLVVGDSYTNAPTHVLGEFVSLTRELSNLVVEYHNRCDAVVKEFIVHAISQRDLPDNLFATLKTDDLFQRLDKIIANQPQTLMGNVRYGRIENQGGRLTAFHLSRVGADPDDVVRYGNPILSLSTESVLAYATDIERLVRDQITLIEKMEATSRSAYATVASSISKLTRVPDDVDEDDNYFDSGLNTADLLRVESQLVAEIGRICDRFSLLQTDAVLRINAALTLVEESVFQD